MQNFSSEGILIRRKELFPFFRPSSHRTRSTSQQAGANNGTHCGQWECSHSFQATSKGLHANLLAHPVWTGPKKQLLRLPFFSVARGRMTGFCTRLGAQTAGCERIWSNCQRAALKWGNRGSFPITMTATIIKRTSGWCSCLLLLMANLHLRVSQRDSRPVGTPTFPAVRSHTHNLCKCVHTCEKIFSLRLKSVDARTRVWTGLQDPFWVYLCAFRHGTPLNLEVTGEQTICFIQYFPGRELHLTQSRELHLTRGNWWANNVLYTKTFPGRELHSTLRKPVSSPPCTALPTGHLWRSPLQAGSPCAGKRGTRTWLAGFWHGNGDSPLKKSSAMCRQMFRAQACLGLVTTHSSHDKTMVVFWLQ